MNTSFRERSLELPHNSLKKKIKQHSEQCLLKFLMALILKFLSHHLQSQATLGWLKESSSTF